MKNLKDLTVLKYKLSQCAQKVYDDWFQNEEGYDEMVGYGGICHLIADEMVSILYDNDIDCTTISSDHEVHVYVVCKLEEGVFKVDIPYSLYETGCGYTWKKIDKVSFNEDFIYIDQLSYDSNDFEKEYCEDL